MSSLAAYKYGIHFLVNNKKMLFVLFVINLSLAVFISMPINSYIDQSIGDSISMKAFNNGFDYMLISDFLDNYGMGIDAILSQSYLSLLFLFLISVFISGAILWAIKEGIFSNLNLFTGGASYFWKLLRLSILFIVLYFFLFVFVFSIFKAINGGLSPFMMESDACLVSSFWICLFFCGLIATFLSCLHNIAKINIINSNSNWVFTSIVQSIKLMKKYFLDFFGIFLINFSLLIVVSFVYFLLRKYIPCEGGLGLVVWVLVAQLYILCKIGLNIVNIASFYFMYKNKFDVIHT